MKTIERNKKRKNPEKEPDIITVEKWQAPTAYRKLQRAKFKPYRYFQNERHYIKAGEIVIVRLSNG